MQGNDSIISSLFLSNEIGVNLFKIPRFLIHSKKDGGVAVLSSVALLRMLSNCTLLFNFKLHNVSGSLSSFSPNISSLLSISKDI